MREIFRNTVNQLRFFHALSTAVAIFLSALVLLFCGEMGGLWNFMLPFGIGLAVLLGVINTWTSISCLQPVGELCQLLDNGSKVSEERIQRAWSILKNFGKNEKLRTLILWVLGGLLFIALVRLFVLLTLWQILWIFLAAATGFVLSVVFSLGRGVSGIYRLRQALGEKLAEKPAEVYNFRSVFLWSSMVLLLGTLLLTVNASTSLQRQLALSQLNIGEKTALTLALKYNQIRQGHPDWKAEKVFESVMEGRQDSSHYVLVDKEGQALTAFTGDRLWLSQLVRSEVESWRERRAPFVYRIFRTAEGNFFVWYHPLESHAFIFGGAGIWAFWLIVVIAGIVLMVFVGGTFRQEVMNLSRQLSAVASGRWGDVENIETSGVLSPLVTGWKGLIRQFRSLAQEHDQLFESFVRESQRLVEAVSEIKACFEGRSDLTEQTATAIIEMRSAIQSVTEQLESLRQTGSDSQSAVIRLEQSIKEVAKAAENVYSLIENSASAITQVSISLQQVLSSVESLEKIALENSTSLSIIEKSLQVFEDNARQTIKLIGNIAELAKSGTPSVTESITGIKEVQQVTAEAQQIINRLGRQIETIGKILTVIGDVAEQTNLLSLNAAIIAAAAGEHGKGFGVVADEIKELADRTSTSTKEIAGLIRNIQADSRRAMETIERSSLSVKKGVELVEKVQQLLSEIQTLVEQANQASSVVVRSLSEHSGVTERLSEYTNRISDLVRQIKRALSEQSQGGAMLRKTAENMKEEAQFVQRATAEQERLVEEVTGNMAKIADMVSMVGKAMVEQSGGVNHVTKVVVKVRDEAEGDQQRVRHIAQLSENLLKAIKDGKEKFASFWRL